MEKKRDNKKRRSVLTVLASLVLCVVFVTLLVFFRYYPRYVREKEPVSIPASESQITVMSYNLRCLTPLDLGKKSWFYRAALIMDDLQAQAPDIIGFQEATKWQHDYLLDCLPEYGSIITYRDDSMIAEGCPIYYHGGRFTMVDQGTFWLSETPEVMSKDWGAAHYRVCSYAILRDKTTGEELVVFNTHLDHVSDEARINGIGVILDKIEEFGGLPAIIMGDLNAEEGSATYVNATVHFLDARYEAAQTTDSYTYHVWGDVEKSCRIDYFLLSRDAFSVESYTVLAQPHDGIWSSDHAPLVMKLFLEE